MRLEGHSIAKRVLDREDQPHGTPMLRGQPLPLLIGAAVLCLEVGRHALDLADDDLPGSEVTGIDRLPMLTDEDFELGMPERMRLACQVLGMTELSGVTE
ncbi:MAG: hypothetical protein LC798_20825 [Chloroflexi bacterium]|nr:hypothetical protein [Chloroflexota bacterium]